MSCRGASYAEEKPKTGVWSVPDFPRFLGSGMQVYLVGFQVSNPPVNYRRFENGTIRTLTEYQRLIVNQLGHKALTSTVFKSFNAYGKVHQGFNRSN